MTLCVAEIRTIKLNNLSGRQNHNDEMKLLSLQLRSTNSFRKGKKKKKKEPSNLKKGNITEIFKIEFCQRLSTPICASV